MRELKLVVEGMSCSHCENAVKNAVLELEGTKSVAVDLSEKIVKIECDDNIPTDQEIKDAIEDQGYDVV